MRYVPHRLFFCLPVCLQNIPARILSQRIVLFGALLSWRHFPGGHPPCSRSFDFQGSVPVDKNYLTEKNSLLPYMQEVGKIRKTAIFPRFWKCAIMDDKSRIYPDERGHLYVHKTIAAGTAERFTDSR